MVLLINHTKYMLDQEKMHLTDYNLPLVQFYRYTNLAKLKGAEKVAKMEVEYAAVLRVKDVRQGLLRTSTSRYSRKALVASLALCSAGLNWTTQQCLEVKALDGYRDPMASSIPP